MEENKNGIPMIIVVPIFVVLVLLIVLAVFFILNAKSANTKESAFEASFDTSDTTGNMPPKASKEKSGELTADEYNELSVEERDPISKEEFEALPEDDVYIDPKLGEKEIIPGVLPTKGQALSYLYSDALYCYNVIGIYSGIPIVIDDPWETKDGGWACFVNNEVGTTVLWAIVDADGKINMGLYGSEYNRDFVGIMYNTEGDNPDSDTIELLESKIMEKYGNTKKLKIVSCTDTSVTLRNKEGVETVINLTDDKSSTEQEEKEE